jgi:hypothetical protein
VAQYKGRTKTRNLIHSSPTHEAVNITPDTSTEQQQHSTVRPHCLAWTGRSAAYRAFLQPRHGSTLCRSTGHTSALDSASLIHQESQTITAYLPYCTTKTTIIIHIIHISSRSATCKLPAGNNIHTPKTQRKTMTIDKLEYPNNTTL